jgi:hypothetical protein
MHLRRKRPALEHSAAGGRCQGSGAVSLHQYYASHRPTGDALGAGQQLDLASPATQPSWRMCA